MAKKEGPKKIKFEGNCYSNEPTWEYTKRGPKSKLYYILPEYHKTEKLVLEIEIANKELENLRKHKPDRYSGEQAAKDYGRQLGKHEYKIKENREELEKRKKDCE